MDKTNTIYYIHISFLDKLETKTGRIPDWNKFDNVFFGMTGKTVQHLDPMSGHMLESSFEAMVDAGEYTNV